MSKKQLLALFLCYLVIWTVGNGLIPLLPALGAALICQAFGLLELPLSQSDESEIGNEPHDAC